MSLSLAVAKPRRRPRPMRAPSKPIRVMIAAGIGLTTALAPAVAYAEGSFNTNLSAVHDGFKTRYWDDQ